MTYPRDDDWNINNVLQDLGGWQSTNPSHQASKVDAFFQNNNTSDPNYQMTLGKIQDAMWGVGWNDQQNNNWVNPAPSNYLLDQYNSYILGNQNRGGLRENVQNNQQRPVYGNSAIPFNSFGSSQLHSQWSPFRRF